jgi:hypothetical protein
MCWGWGNSSVGPPWPFFHHGDTENNGGSTENNFIVVFLRAASVVLRVSVVKAFRDPGRWGQRSQRERVKSRRLDAGQFVPARIAPSQHPGLFHHQNTKDTENGKDFVGCCAVVRALVGGDRCRPPGLAYADPLPHLESASPFAHSVGAPSRKGPEAMSTKTETRWYLAPAMRITALAMISAVGSVASTGWLRLLFSLTSIALAIAGTYELRHARQRRAAENIQNSF